MFRALFFVMVIVAGYTATNAEEVELYSDKYDYIDVHATLANDRLREQYYDCFMDTGPCVTADAVYFKGNFPEAIATKCKKCTEKQKENFAVIVEWYAKNQPEKWNALIAKFIDDAIKLNL